jgi:hypothetical protein
MNFKVAGEASWLAAIREDGRADLIARGKGALGTLWQSHPRQNKHVPEQARWLPPQWLTFSLSTIKQTNWDTGILEKGQSKTINFSQPGNYYYICAPHPWMYGQVIVE